MRHAFNLLRQTRQGSHNDSQVELSKRSSRLHLRPTARDLIWLSHIQLHGPQSSRYLFALTKRSHKCLDTSLRRLQQLRLAGLLSLPTQQRQTINANFHPHVYDITTNGRELLFDHGILEDTVRPSGHWWHGYLTSCITSSIEIAAHACGIGFIPAHRTLAKKDSSLAIPLGNSKLIPDQLFALKYKSGFRAFALEVDRGTEPRLSSARRKSYAQSLAMYEKLISTEAYRKHYGLNANLLVLWVFNRRTNEAQFLEFVRKYAPTSTKSILTKTIDEEALLREPDRTLLDQPWNRASGEVVQIGLG